MTDMTKIRSVTFRGGPYDGVVIECQSDTIDVISPEWLTPTGHFVVGSLPVDEHDEVVWPPAVWRDANQLDDGDDVVDSYAESDLVSWSRDAGQT